MDIRIGQAYVGDDGQWCYYTQQDCDAYNQGGKDAYYGRQNRLHDGDYDKETVADEKQDLNYGWDGIPMKNMRIVKTSDDQTEIDAALDKLNGKAGLS